MRVLQAMAGAAFGGAEAFFMRLVPALSRAGVEQRVVIRAHGRRSEALAQDGLEPVEVAFGGPFDVGTRWRLWREIRRFRPQVVMTWMNRATMLCPHGPFVHVARLGGYYDAKYYRKCDYLVANTEDIVEHLVESGFPRDRVHHLPNFVAGERAQPAARRPLYTPAAASVVLALGRLHPNKGFDVLIHALAHLPEAYLWIAGEGPERRALEKLAARLAVKPRVRFLGWRDDVPSLLAASDVFVCPSRHEPLGNVVLEAWAQAVPVVAAASQGPGALITDRRNGILVPVDDAVTLADAVRYVLNNKAAAAHLAANGRAAYEAGFTEARVVARYVQFFAQVAETA